MNSLIKSVILVVMALFMVFTSVLSGQSAEIDDSTVFVEAFNAYQQKDYLLTIEKCDQLIQVFPESPLRDVTLLLIARASLKSGDNLRAAESVTLFTNEFPENRLKASVENELKVLVNRHQKGEVLAADKSLQAAAKKVSSDRIARERAAAEKLEMERIAKVKAEQERLAKIKLEEERLERERLLAEKLAKANIKIAISLSNEAGPYPVGISSTVPIEITNKGNSSEELLLTINAAKEYGAVLTRSGRPDESVTRLQLAAGETFKGVVQIKMPTEMVDGHRSLLSVHAVSAKFSDVAFRNETVVICSAPLVRAVAKLAKPKVAPGEQLSYRVAVLNVGSQSAESLTVRVQLPSEIDFQGTSDTPFKRESNGALLFKVDKVDVGQLVHINLDVKVRENTAAGQVLRGEVEVENGGLQKKERFTATASVVVIPAK